MTWYWVLSPPSQQAPNENGDVTRQAFLLLLGFLLWKHIFMEQNCMHLQVQVEVEGSKLYCPVVWCWPPVWYDVGLLSSASPTSLASPPSFHVSYNPAMWWDLLQSHKTTPSPHAHRKHCQCHPIRASLALPKISQPVIWQLGQLEAYLYFLPAHYKVNIIKWSKVLCNGCMIPVIWLWMSLGQTQWLVGRETPSQGVSGSSLAGYFLVELLVTTTRWCCSVQMESMTWIECTFCVLCELLHSAKSASQLYASSEALGTLPKPFAAKFAHYCRRI